jgi:hypothetical protein
MPSELRVVLDYLVSIGVTAGVVAGAISWVAQLWFSERLKARIKSEYDEKLEALKAQLKSQYDEKLETHKSQLKAQGDVALERLKSELSVTAAQRNLQFSHLNEKRADVIAEVYASLREAHRAVKEYTGAFKAAFRTTPPREEVRKSAEEAADRFAKIYQTKQIFVPAIAAFRLDQINDELKKVYRQFEVDVDKMQDNPADRMRKWIELNRKLDSLADVALRELEAEFRKLLGDEAANIPVSDSRDGSSTPQI